MAATPEPEKRIARYDWEGIRATLDRRGWAVLPKLLTARECTAVAGLYAKQERFRKTVVMARHGYGRGAYRYFDYPLPELVAGLRATLYPRLAQLASRWYRDLRFGVEFPDSHAEFLTRCHTAG